MHMEKRRDEYGVVVYGHFVAAPVVSLSYDFLYRLRFNCNSAEKLRWWLALGHILYLVDHVCHRKQLQGTVK
ncbi:hypothetical protein F2Q68_00007966 [Brassica cretica]|uniref:Uncharacterized protein n=1 Tax=Brassica cretica TaxID=69181 RepID=A0A8S9L2F8_BRACR|nr:hypothetical protein F2Q68_00007966 [Brassica cretica]